MSDYENAAGDDSSNVSDEALYAAVAEAVGGEEAAPVETLGDIAPAPRETDPREVIRQRMARARDAKASKAEQYRQSEMQTRLHGYEQAERSRELEKPSFDIDGFKERLRSSPLTALQELGVNLDDFTAAAIEESSPQSKIMVQMRAMQDKIAAMEKHRDEAAERESSTTRSNQTRRADEEFCSVITIEEYPSLHEFFGNEDVPGLLKEAREVARDFVQKGGDPETISNEDIAWYLEQKYAKKLTRIKGKTAAMRVAQPVNGSNRPRSPSQASASDTRLGGQKDFYDLSPSEQDALLNEVVRLEMQKSAS